MTELLEAEVAQVSSKRALSFIWFIPVLALVIGLWMVYHHYQSQGPLIQLQLTSATGIEKGKTKVKVREVDVGLVVDVSLHADSNGVNVSIQMDKQAEELLKQDSQFWVVTPKVTADGISGLGTLLSGAYIEMAPGVADELAEEFIGLNDAPITPKGTPGLRLVLNSDKEFAYSAGDPIIYKGLKVGKIEEVSFDFDQRIVYYKAFIKAPYHQLVTENTLFWNASGIKLELSTEGITVSSASLETLITNGVTFGLAEGELAGEAVTNEAEFDIHPSYKEAITPSFDYKVEYLVLVSDTVRGLTIGAPVEYRGIKVGRVAKVNFLGLEQDTTLTKDYRIPVLIELIPGLVGLPDNETGQAMIASQNGQWIKQGLKAKLQVGNLLTGKLFVDLQHYPDQPIDKVETRYGYTIIPSTLDDFKNITLKASDFLDKLNQLPLDQLAEDVLVLIDDFKAAAKTVESAGDGVDELLSEVQKQEVMHQLNAALASIAALAESYSQGSAPHGEISDAFMNLNERLQELEPILLQLDQKPNSLIFSGDEQSNRQPQAAKPRREK